MRISDWSSDVCSSDLQLLIVLHIAAVTYWIGALPPLLMMCRRSNANRLGAAAKRFGDIAAYVVGTLVEIGRASRRDRVCQYVAISEVAVTFKNKQQIEHRHNYTSVSTITTNHK